MKKNILLIILCGLALLGWFTVVYQNEQQQASEKRLEQSVIEQLAYRRQVEDSIKNDMDARKRTQAYVVQIEHERQAEDSLNQMVADAQQRQTEYEQQLQSSIEARLGEYGQKQSVYEQQLAAYKEQVGLLSQKEESNSRSAAEYSSKSITHDKLITELENRIKEQGAQIGKYRDELSVNRRQLVEYKSLLDESLQKLLALEQQVSEFKKQPQAAVVPAAN